jgi:hypothetical protein
VRDAWVTSVAGLVGVLVGAWLGPVLTSRTLARADARLAARLARAGLKDWLQAVEHSKTATNRLNGQPDFDIILAIELGGLRQSLDLRWWEDNKSALLRRAHAEDEHELVMAAKACRYVLARLEWLGDAGLEMHEKKARARIASRPRATHALGRDDGPATATGQPSAEAGDLLPAGARAQVDAIFRALDDAEAGLADLKVDVAGLDHRIGLVRDIWTELNDLGPKLESAMAACRTIEGQSGWAPAPGR